MGGNIEFSLLKQVQSYVIKYANVISEVLNVDIEIVDRNLVRIAGTGAYSSKIDESSEGMSYKKVLETGMYNVILEPRDDECCINCKLRNSCKEFLELATPIYYDEQIIGIIGLVCSNQEQKDIILKNVKENLRFLDNIAELIQSKIYEEFSIKNESQFLMIIDKFMNSVETGAIVLDNENKIHSLNEVALKQLLINDSIYSSKQDIKLQEFNTSEYNGFEIPMNLGKYKSIFIFNTKELKKAYLLDSPSSTQRVGIDRIVGESKAIKNMKSKAKKIASSISTVLITGESGTGKEVLARAIHESSDRKDKPFIAINCAAIPESLLESELLGYAKGAFSGANPQGKMGKFELANHGVIFLDEIGDMPLNLQAKILRVIQERQCIRIGSNKLIDLDIRIIAATNKDLKKLVEEKKFREDLYYRLNVIPIKSPPLREREGDIEYLVKALVEKYNKILHTNKKDITLDALEKMKNYNWPGNVRELENCIEYMLNISMDSDIIDVDSLPDDVVGYETTKMNNNLLNIEDELTLEDLEKKYIMLMVDKYGCDLKAKKIISDKLGIGIATLYRKMEKQKIISKETHC
ncbi:MAG: sigma-54 interaction domain-containing protein [Sarcina sp.]